MDIIIQNVYFANSDRGGEARGSGGQLIHMAFQNHNVKMQYDFCSSRRPCEFKIFSNILPEILNIIESAKSLENLTS